jgi:hypothetical protein
MLWSLKFILILSPISMILNIKHLSLITMNHMTMTDTQINHV